MRISDWSSDVCSSDLPNLQPKYLGSPQSPVGIQRKRRRGLLQHPATDLAGTLRSGISQRRRTRQDFRAFLDRKSVVSGKSVSVRVDLGGRRIIKKKHHLAFLNAYTLNSIALD